MKTLIRQLGYRIIVWAVPYATSLALIPLIQRDPIFFGTIMIVEGSIVGTMLAVAYFQHAPRTDAVHGLMLGLRDIPMVAIAAAIGSAWRKRTIAA